MLGNDDVEFPAEHGLVTPKIARQIRPRFASAVYRPLACTLTALRLSSPATHRTALDVAADRLLDVSDSAKPRDPELRALGRDP